MRFDQLLYNDNVLDALDAMRFEECTPIQAQAIPIAEEGRDLIAIAQTGTGKTAAYLLPVIDRLADGGYPEDAINCIVMAPTRELVMQIDRQMQGFAYFLPVSSSAIYGGTDGKTFDQQKHGLVTGADVVIATPGRLLAHLQMGYVDLSRVSFFILDEADRMLDMGFYDDIMKVASYLPADRQTLMFSATMPPKIRQLAQNLLHDPAEVKIAISKPAEKIDQSAYVCYDGQKEALLQHIFRETPPDRVIVFASKKTKVKQLARSLRGKKYTVGEMHSDLEQTAREQMMLDFKAGRVQVLVATDIVSRGIDIDDISLIVNFDVPMEAEDYVHRVGRTARAERTGRAITFIGDKEQRKFQTIERLIEREIPKKPLPDNLGEAPAYQHERRQRPERRGSKPGRKAHGNRNRQAKDAPAAKAQKPQQPPQQPPTEKSDKPAKKRRFYRSRSRKKASGAQQPNPKPSTTQE